MKDQHTLIKGYRDLTQVEIDAMNSIKELAQDVGNLIEDIENAGYADKRWLAIAKTDLQKAFMCFVRAVAQPQSF